MAITPQIRPWASAPGIAFNSCVMWEHQTFLFLVYSMAV